MSVSRFSNSTIINGFPKVMNLSYTTNKIVTDLSPTFWLDAADSAYITLSGSDVTTWSDKSGNGRNFSQGNSSYYPVYNATGLNNKPALEFNASGGGTGGKWLDYGSSGFPLHANSSSPLTMFFVVKFSNPTWQQFYFTWNRTSSNCTNYEAGLYDMGGNRGGRLTNGIHLGCSKGYVGGMPADEGIYIIMLQLKGSGSSPDNVLHRINRQTITGTNSSAGAYLNASSYPTVNGTCRIGARKDGDTTNNDSFFNGSISEIIMYKSELSLTEIQSVENYLSDKWGIA